jgi:hypothetical protein
MVMDDRERQEMTPAQRRARDAVRRLGRPAADAAFRERLRRDFISGAIGGAADRDAQRRAARARAWWRGLRWSWAAPLTAAAALLIVLWSANQGPAPQLLATNGVGMVRIDGRAIPAAESDRLAAALRGGAAVALEDGARLDLLYPGSMIWELTDGTQMTLPDPPGRWFGRGTAAAVGIGEAHVLTGPAFPGSRLTIRTDEGLVELTGTLVSVFRDSLVTCVCVQEGTARIGISEQDLEAIPAGRRKVMFRDGRPPMVTAIAPPHRDHLIEFEARVRGGF